MKDDLISRQAAIEALSLGKEMLGRVLDYMDVVGTDREKYSWGLGLIESNINDIEDLPSVELERKKGKWLTEYLDGIPGRRAEIKYCSECCQVSPYRHNFCPNCGADMRGE